MTHKGIDYLFYRYLLSTCHKNVLNFSYTKFSYKLQALYKILTPSVKPEIRLTQRGHLPQAPIPNPLLYHIFISFSSIKMEEAGKNGIPSNAIVLHRKLSIKKRTGLQAIWAAILLHFKFRVSKKTSIAVAPKLDKTEDTIEFPTNSETTWKDIVGGIRPLHMLQQLEYHSYASLPPPPPPPPHFDKETYHDVSLPPSSPARSYDGMSSRYCSAEDLHALDKDRAVDEEGGSDMINTQADEFIAKFYEQIRLQRLHC